MSDMFNKVARSKPFAFFGLVGGLTSAARSIYARFFSGDMPIELVIGCGILAFVAVVMSDFTVGLTSVDNKKYEKLSVVGLMLKKQNEARNYQLGLLGAFSLFYMASAWFFNYEINIVVMIIVLLIYALVYFRSYLMKQRVLSGTYGTTEDDAREIISFALRNHKLMGGDGGKGRPIITREDMIGIIESAINEVSQAKAV